MRVSPYLTSRPPLTGETPVARGDKVRLLFANSINERKGLGHLLDALALLDADTRSRLHLTVVGDGPLREAMERKSEALGLSGDVSFVGRRSYDALGSFYADADILVVPSLVDYRSLASFEGLNHGLALLISENDGASHETVVDGETGFMIAPGDHRDFADKIERIVCDDALLRRLQTGSARLARDRFSIDRIADNIADSIDLAKQRATGRTPMRPAIST
ncbi:glycosyltransferase family 4 protein [Croceicoccus sp. YJ47]|uniref:glycosyltransferase family 4 protein n=1 Tax=Croceicoccus sp. YJ47 TaxID=2798724 RepID=UPI001923032F|nr:glycosyltransferase family 4 protein [Croceicoccus sp. YJ47]QQN72989.1 glycosyltransferase family 4 protein [Croceicoccus sp. YJ47]